MKPFTSPFNLMNNHRVMQRYFLRITRAIKTIGVVLLLLKTSAGWSAALPENELKAAFIVRFTEFVEWPEETDNKALTICILGNHPIEQELTQASRITARAQPIKIQHVEQADDTDSCSVLFVPRSQASKMPHLHQLIRSKPVLVIGDSPGLAHLGAAINFYKEDNRLRFEINPGVVKAAGLKASSRLLKLANIVE